MRVRITERLTEQPYQSGSRQIFGLGGFRVMTHQYPAYNYGDVLVVEGELKAMDGSNGSRVLPWVNEDFWLIYPDIELVSDGDLVNFPDNGMAVVLGKKMVALRQRIVGLFKKMLPEPHASLISGIVLGVREQMPEDFHTALRETGTLHVIAASGMNVTIVAAIIMGIFVRLFSRRKAIVLVILGVGFYAWLSGGSAPVIRAALMGVVAYIGAFLGREREGLGLLVLVAAGMLIWNPIYLFDVGWQLSFAATLGILLGQPVVKEWLPRKSAERRIRGKGWLEGFGEGLREELAVTLSAQILTLPLTAYHFGQFSWIAPVVNVLVAPVVPVITVWGVVVAVVGWVWEGLGQVLAWGAWGLLEYFVKVVEVFGPPAGGFGAVEVDDISFWWVVVYYLALALIYWRLKIRSDNKMKGRSLDESGFNE